MLRDLLKQICAGRHWIVTISGTEGNNQMEKRASCIPQQNGVFFTKSSGPLLVPWEFSLMMQKEGKKKSSNRDWIHTIDKITLLSIRKYSDILISDKRVSPAVWIMIWVLYSWERLLQRLISIWSLLELPLILCSPYSLSYPPLFNVKFVSTTLKSLCCCQGEGTSPCMQEVAVTTPMQL